ncbi:GNAT family N-acetyltransferase [Clostridium cylindrosporum]|uniref:GCN5-like N-acetyltransferase n=1 Tax=Clostridium cylindrosporum DSM 605 TaxID=1121307 RepID=A0A0J8G1J6_CLOCY|nr:GNAT family N-acetyltransferase [Clostridium cylindrosporum]KMT21631.1 GCN5-like N-acetyltransferase [Clostridium cylindrosporum DSM 605]
MLFEGKDFFVDITDVDDLIEITKVYNSNKNFLVNHMDKEVITYDWLLEDVKGMKNAGFSPCKIVDKCTGKIFGLIEFKISNETYLSLLMLHCDYLNQGLGSLIFHEFEKYIRTTKSTAIRIDVVTSYDRNVLNFWRKNGFSKLKDIELSWGQKTLSAALMKKGII